MTYSNGVKRTFDAQALSDDIKRSLILHGLQQKLSDRFAGANGDADIAVKASDSVYATLASGEWGAKRGTGDGPSTALVVRAIAELRGKTIEAVLATWKTLAEDVRKNIAKDENVRKAMAAIKLREAEAAASAKATPAADLSAF
jgi:hypothetical protein